MTMTTATTINCLIRSGDLAGLASFLASSAGAVNAFDPAGYAPIHVACAVGATEMLLRWVESPQKVAWHLFTLKVPIM